MKKALLIGINYRKTSSELNGCINDVNSVKELLTTKFRYDEDNITMITDDTKKKPTKKNIIKEMKNIIKSSNEGDEIWIHYSGHGTYVKDTNDDENDGNDEGLVPLDFKTSGLILDDDLKVILSGLDTKCTCVMFFDCCHSGTCCDLSYCYDGSFTSKIDEGKVSANVILISGCKDDQTSADASINNKWSGAMTFYLLKVLNDNKYTIRLGKLLNDLKDELKKNDYTQYPILSSSRPINMQKLFCISADDSPYIE